MRHVPLTDYLVQILAREDGKAARVRLCRAHRKAERMQSGPRQQHIKRNGGNKWSPIKDILTQMLGKKCWYTEAELVGASLVIDHYRPVCNYWWLAYEASNFRVACPFANSPMHNPERGCSGGKGDNFPLLAPGIPATENNREQAENPVILDPCVAADCDLLAFQADGRPILNPAHASEPEAETRVEQSKLFLNLDHPEFNSKREQLCHFIAEDVDICESLPEGVPQRTLVRSRLKQRLAPNAPFSTAARYYLKLHRHLDWVEDLLNEH